MSTISKAVVSEQWQRGSMHREKHRLAGFLVIAAAVLESLSIPLHGTDDASHDMISALKAAGPHASLGDQAQTFDRFVGTWDCDYGEFKEDGSTEHSRGEVIFGWILDGRAVQDVWISLEPNGERQIGTTVRFFDPKAGKWRIIWVDPTSCVIKKLSGGAIGDRIVLEGTGDGDLQIRWSFNEIRQDSFVWRSEQSRDSGRTWRLTLEHHLKRRSVATPGKNSG